MTWQSLFGEAATTKIAAIFDDRQAAATAATSLHSTTGLQAVQIRMVKPHEKDYARKLEPEPKGIARTAVRSHLYLGAAGLLAGALVWAAFYIGRIPAITSSPGLSGGVFLAFGAVGGMLIGGLVTARPDHQIVIQRVDTATKEGKWSVVVHPKDSKQCDEVLALLSELPCEVVRSV